MVTTGQACFNPWPSRRVKVKAIAPKRNRRSTIKSRAIFLQGADVGRDEGSLVRAMTEDERAQLERAPVGGDWVARARGMR